MALKAPEKEVGVLNKFHCSKFSLLCRYTSIEYYSSYSFTWGKKANVLIIVTTLIVLETFPSRKQKTVHRIPYLENKSYTFLSLHTCRDLIARRSNPSPIA